MVLLGDTPLLGPPPAELFDPVPREDYVKASLAGIDALLRDLEWDTHNVVLTLVRIWVTLATDTVRSKDGAAEWALRVLPREHHGVLVDARAIYRGHREGWAEPPMKEPQAFAAHAVREIHVLASKI